MRISLLFIFCMAFAISLLAQKQKVDSLILKFQVEKIDTNKVILLGQLATASNLYNPDSSLLYAQKALYLAQKIKYVEGESRSLSVLAAAFRSIGNYPKALEFYLQKLQIEENRHNPASLASALMYIGILYIYQEQYDDALLYYKKADSVIQQDHVEDMAYYSFINLGDVYWRLNRKDSSFIFFNKSFTLATAMNDKDLMGTSMVGLAHIYLKENNFDSSLYNYLQGLAYLEASNDDDVICEATLGLARLYEQRNLDDSAEYYATRSFNLAKQDGFESRQLDAASFLTEHFRKTNDISNAFKYIKTAQALRDSVYSKEKIRQSQVIASNEQLRQNEIAETQKRIEEERKEELQMLLIGIFILMLFLITLLLSRTKVHYRIIKFLGIISLLMFFEFLLLLLHPAVAELTHRNPVLEILIFVSIASVLIPTHHKIEHWLIEKLTTKKVSPMAEETELPEVDDETELPEASEEAGLPEVNTTTVEDPDPDEKTFLL